MITAARHLLFCFFLIANTQLVAQELDIKRTKKLVTSIQEDGLPPGWKRLGDDLFQVRFNLPHFSEQLYESNPSKPVDDPFGSSNTGISHRTNKRITAQQALEALGIPFNQLSSASYDYEANILTVTNTADSIQMIDVFVGSYIGSGQPKRISVRLEIYEVTQLQALQQQESAGSAGNHAPERTAVLAAVKNGNAKLATIVSLTTSAGQRARLIDAIDFPPPILTEKEAAGETDDLEHHQVGTVLEMEPNVGADGITIQLNVMINHHTAPPELTGSQPRIHEKSISTNLALIDGHYILVGNWTPTGKPEYQNKDLAQVAFITASIQTPDIYAEPGTIITTEEEISK